MRRGTTLRCGHLKHRLRLARRFRLALNPYSTRSVSSEEAEMFSPIATILRHYW